MISATGKRSDGFTVIELLVVITIILIVSSLVVLGSRQIRKKSSQRKTESVMEQVKVAIDLYRTHANRYPVDGIDTKLRTPEGTRIQSGAALSFQLTQPIKVMKLNAAGKPTGSPVVKDSPLSATEDLVRKPTPDKEAIEIVDGWGLPLHYDNTASGFSRQGEDGGQYHLAHDGFHDPDPRDSQRVSRPGEPQSPNYDLWSHGPTGHTSETTPEAAVVSWQVIEN